MLSKEQLTEALHDGLRAADPKCGRFCTSGAEIEDGNGYRIWHNGTGSVKGDNQVVYATKPLAETVGGMAQRITKWIDGQHRREMVDLNAAMEIDTSGPAVIGWPWPVGESGPAVVYAGNVGITPYITTTFSPNVMTTWRWQDGTAP